MIDELRKEMAAYIRMLEDAAAMESTSSIYVLIGKLSRTQSLIDELENKKEWVNEIE